MQNLPYNEKLILNCQLEDLKLLVKDELYYQKDAYLPLIINDLKNWIETLENIENQKMIKYILDKKEQIKHRIKIKNKSYEYFIPIDYKKRGKTSLINHWDEVSSENALEALNCFIKKIVVLYGGGMSKYGNSQKLVFFNNLIRKKESNSNNWTLEAEIYSLKWKKDIFGEKFDIKIPFLEQIICFLGSWKIGILKE